MTALDELRKVADYQFGAGAGDVLLPAEEALSVTRTSSGRPRQIHAADGNRLATYGTDGRFRLGLAGGRRLQAGFVRDGRNAFAKFVRRADDRIRPRDEVLVEHEDGSLLAVGRAELSGEGMVDFESGMAVHVRDSTG
ncbi:pseudouridine synthase [Halobacteriales archaeon QS_4_66_20]|nr:MAG: pseudouridine synthase [Halobacteriales archaeon QS_4_66_20]